MDRTPELACIPSAIPAAERQGHFKLARELFGQQAQERAALPSGYAIRFPADALRAIAQFVSNERKCCPFMHFELTLGAGSEALWLRMTGPEGTRDVLDAELNLADSCSCG
jgi:hypothetical protein